MPQLGPAEVLVILVVALLVFGPKRLPDVGRQVGRGLRELRKLQDTVRDELHGVINAPDPSPSGPPTYGPSTPAPSGTGARAAPSRFRAAPRSGLPPGAAAPTASDRNGSARAGTEASRRGARAPSRFRAPGR
jgi:TatA/E family protein of Tat protein translocase